MKLFRQIFNFKSVVALQPGGMISVLFDYQCHSDRRIVADDLAEYDEPIVQHALYFIACDFREEQDIREACGKSLAEIWWRNSIYDEEKLMNFTDEALGAFDREYNQYRSSED